MAQIETKAKADGIGMDEASHLLIGEKQPQVRFTTVEQIAGLALFLASDTASNMQGTLWCRTAAGPHNGEAPWSKPSS